MKWYDGLLWWEELAMRKTRSANVRSWILERRESRAARVTVTQDVGELAILPIPELQELQGFRVTPCARPDAHDPMLCPQCRVEVA